MEQLKKIKRILQKCGKTAYWTMFLSMLIYRFLNTTLFFENIDVLYAGEGVISRICTVLFLQPQSIIAAIVILLCLTEEPFHWKHTGMTSAYCMLLL